jgi:DNA mismatch endonuclease (patch repair protein)
MHRHGLRFRVRVAVLAAGLRVVPDTVFPRARVAVFVDGCWWHRCPEHGVTPKSNTAYWLPKLARNVERDREVDTALASAGWTVVRAWEHEVRADADRLAAMIAAAVTST